MLTVLDFIKSRRDAIGHVRALADAIIAQNERKARGWDQGRFRDDVTTVELPYAKPIAQVQRERAAEAVAVAEAFR